MRHGSFPSVAAGALAMVLAACAQAPTAPPAAATPSAATAGSATPARSSPQPTPRPSLDRAGLWREDLARIVPGLERIHPDPFHATPKAELEAAIADLGTRAVGLSSDELLVGVMRIGAMVSAEGCDGHTGVFPWGTGSYPLESLPLRLWLFGDDLVVVDALPPYADLVGATIEAVEGQPIAEVRAALDPLIPRDNEQTVRLLTPRYLLIPQVLRGLGLANEDAVELRTMTDGAARDIQVEPIPMVEYNAWAGQYGLHLPADPDVLWLSRIDDALWSERLADEESLFVQHNRVDRLTAPLDELRDALHADGVERVILDLRHNFGGEVSAIDPMLALFDDPVIDRPDRLFVLTGRNTFSAASMFAGRLEAQTAATFVGEPMGGCPTLYGDPREVRLPSSGIVLLVASELSVGVDPNDTRSTIELDAAAELTVEDWLDGRDPALESILGFDVAP